MLRLLFNGLMPKNDDNDGYEPHRIQLFRHCAASRRLSVCLSVIQLPEKQKKTITNPPGRVGAFGLGGSRVGSGIKAKG